MFLETNATGRFQHKMTKNEFLYKKILNRVWKIIHSNICIGACGTAAGSYVGYTFGPSMIDASVRYACNRFLHGLIGRLAGAIAAPFFSNYLANTAIPVVGVAGGIGTLGIYHSIRWIYSFCYPDCPEEDLDLFDSIKLIVKTLVLTSAIHSEKANELMNELSIHNPELADIILKCLVETIRDLEEKKMMEEGFEVIDDLPAKLQIMAGGDIIQDQLIGAPE